MDLFKIDNWPARIGMYVMVPIAFLLLCYSMLAQTCGSSVSTASKQVDAAVDVLTLETTVSVAETPDAGESSDVEE
jgi:hypothetical protein